MPISINPVSEVRTSLNIKIGVRYIGGVISEEIRCYRHDVRFHKFADTYWPLAFYYMLHMKNLTRSSFSPLAHFFERHCVSYTDAEGDPDHIGKRELVLASP